MAQDNVNIQTHGESRDQETPTETSQPRSTETKSNRGFASMDPSKQREIASKGGRAAHEKGTAHQFSANEAREAGKKGGGTVSQDRHHMAEIGRIGGQARGRKQRATAQRAGDEAGAGASKTEGGSRDTSDKPADEPGTKRASGDYSH
jgi:general stress protein YciG